MKNWVLAAVAGAALIGSSPANATLTLIYTAVPTVGGEYHYNFTISLADALGWTAGNQYDWITFGDVPFGNTSPLNDFHNFQTFDPLILTSSGGGHNGPTIGYGGGGVILPGWAPSAVGESISWSGDSANYLGSGQLLWSTVVWSGGNQAANFAVGQLQGSAVPEPATWTMMLLGFGAVSVSIRRRRRTQTLLQAA